jgi:hypothetical protein
MMEVMSHYQIKKKKHAGFVHTKPFKARHMTEWINAYPVSKNIEQTAGI